MREFQTAERRTEAPPSGDIALIKVDDDVFVCRKPADAAFAYLTAASARGTSMADKTKAVLDFIERCLLPDDKAAQYEDADEGVIRGSGKGRQHYTDRLLDQDDPLELEHAVQHLQYLAEEWGGRPTTSPRG